MGVSIASRWSLGERRDEELNVTPRTAGFPSTTLVVEVIAPVSVGPLLFANHFPNWQLSFEHERELQAVVAARFLEQLVGQNDQQVAAHFPGVLSFVASV